MWSDINPAVDTDYMHALHTFSIVKAEQLEKQQTSTKVLSFRKYINYNMPTCTISHL